MALRKPGALLLLMALVPGCTIDFSVSPWEASELEAWVGPRVLLWPADDKGQSFRYMVELPLSDSPQPSDDEDSPDLPESTGHRNPGISLLTLCIFNPPGQREASGQRHDLPFS